MLRLGIQNQAGTSDIQGHDPVPRDLGTNSWLIQVLSDDYEFCFYTDFTVHHKN